MFGEGGPGKTGPRRKPRSKPGGGRRSPAVSREAAAGLGLIPGFVSLLCLCLFICLISLCHYTILRIILYYMVIYYTTQYYTILYYTIRYYSLYCISPGRHSVSRHLCSRFCTARAIDFLTTRAAPLRSTNTLLELLISRQLVLQPSQHEKTHLELIIDVSTTRAATLAALLDLEVTPLGTAAGECSRNARPCKLGTLWCRPW